MSIRHKDKGTRKTINYGYYEDKRIAELTRDFLKENIGIKRNILCLETMLSIS